MTKDELVTAIADKVKRPKADVGLVLDGLRAAVTEGLQRGDTVVLPDLVKLVPHTTSARTGHNPRTGVPLEIAAKATVKAKAVPSLIRQMQA